jgi:molybdate transport system ATP-binding protein
MGDGEHRHLGGGAFGGELFGEKHQKIGSQPKGGGGMSLYVKIQKQLERFFLNVEFETENEVLGLLGASGCGKSMTLKCIAGIEKPDQGQIILNGRTLFDSEKKINLPPQQRRVGYLFQQYALFPNMTVEKNIAVGAHTMDKGQRSQAVRDMMARMQIAQLANKYPSQLSGGQQQRAALGRILINKPEVLLLDEPFSALDDYLKWQVELELADTLKEFGGTTLFVSHSRDEVFRLCKSVCVLSEGKSEEKRSTQELFHSPDTLSASLLSGCKNYTRIKRLDKTHAQALDWGVTITGREIPENATCAGVRSHFIHPTPGENPIDCQVERVVPELFSTVVMLKTPGGDSGWSRLRMEMSHEQWASLHEPNQLTVSISADDIMFLREK